MTLTVISAGPAIVDLATYDLVGGQHLPHRTGATDTTDDAEAAHGSGAMPGDVTNDLVQLADVLGVDLFAAAPTNIDASNKRCPIDAHRDSARKAPS